MIDYSPHHWWRHLLDIRGSMVREIVLRVLSTVFFAVVVTYVHTRVRPLAISDKPHAFIGLALGLLLVFRTNASYDRYWEGRKLWGAIVNSSRNLARRAAIQLGETPQRLNTLLGWLIAFPYATMHGLRGERGLDRGAALLTPVDIEKTLAAEHPALHVSLEASKILLAARRDGQLSDIEHAALEGELSTLVDCLGACERIVKTPLPFPYVVHLRRALILYCLTLPLALVGSFSWMTIVASLLLTYILYGIEEIGVEIENPFEKEENDLPLERICRTIEDNLRQLLC